MIKYIRTKNGKVFTRDLNTTIDYASLLEWYGAYTIIADNVEELIQIGDIVFYWQQSDDSERCEVLVTEDDVMRIKYATITKLLIPIDDNYICVAKACPEFTIINNRRYLVKKGELEI